MYQPNPKAPLIRVLAVDDHPLVRVGIISWIDKAGDMRVVGEATDGEQAYAKTIELKPDVILMDLNMEICSGLDATIRILRDLPMAKIIILTVFEGGDDVVRARLAGAKGYLLKSTPERQLLDAIRAVHRGLDYVSPAVARVMQGANQESCLSRREKEVLILLLEGRSRPEIAQTLNISLGTLKNNISSLYRKCDIPAGCLSGYAIRSLLAQKAQELKNQKT